MSNCPEQSNSDRCTLLIHGATAVVLTGKHNLDSIVQWAIALKQRSGRQKAVAALCELIAFRCASQQVTFPANAP